MALIGYHYNKITAEKKKAAAGKISVSNNIVITEVKEAKILGSSKDGGVEFSFKFTANYEPGVGFIDLEGAVVYIGKNSKDILVKWNEEKKLPPAIVEEFYNHVLSRCNVETLVLSKEMQLPPHIPMPKVKESTSKKD